MATTYQQSIVAFLDILGFRDLIRRSLTDPEIAETIIETLNQAQQQLAKLNDPQEQKFIDVADLQVSMFSDSIAFSCPHISDPSFNGIAGLVMLWQKEMTTRGFFLRGAIVSGAHYHKGGVLLGPAIIHAYDLCDLAGWPRVIIHPDLLRSISPASLATAYRNYLVSDATSGLTYLDYLRNYCLSIARTFIKGSPISTEPISTLLALHKKAILSGVNRLEDKADLRVATKYSCVATYHNWVVNQLLSLVPDVTTYHEMDPNTEPGQFYRNMDEMFSYLGVSKEDITARMDKWFQLMHQDKANLQSCKIGWSPPSQ